jgi:hypothetical protein
MNYLGKHFVNLWNMDIIIFSFYAGICANKVNERIAIINDHENSSLKN